MFILNCCVCREGKVKEKGYFLESTDNPLLYHA